MGLLHRVELYTGRHNDDPNLEREVGKSGCLVLRLLSNVPSFQNFHVYVDNYFNSPKLQLLLLDRGIQMLGTLRLCRAPNLYFSEEQKPQRGTIIEMQYGKDEKLLSAVQWYDNKAVTLLSSFVGADPVGTICRYDKKAKGMLTIPCPEIVNVYNRHMGYVDEFNRYIALYRTSQHCIGRHYLRLFFYLLDAAVVNSWVQHSLACKESGIQKPMSLFEFTADICHCLLRVGQKPTSVTKSRFYSMEQIAKKRSYSAGPNAALVPKDVRLDGFHHLPEIGDRQRCKNLYCDQKTSVFCTKCEKHLCLNASRNCFLLYHTC